MPRILLVLAVAALLAACASASSMINSTGVTPTPADSTPADILAAFDSSFNGPIDILSVEFVMGTSLEVKAAAIAGIRGRVIGGWNVGDPGSEGLYIVRFPSKSAEDLMVIQDKLHKIPAVVAALPMIMGTGFGPLPDSARVAPH